MPDAVINIPYETHCPQCGAEYRNIQHPIKPPGVIMQRLCDCVASTTTRQDEHGNVISITTLTPPTRT